jgi:hypothetical protein
MPIKKRSTVPTAEQAEAIKPLNIQPGVKKPIPREGRINDLLGDQLSGSAVRAIGSLAASIHDPTDETMTAHDRVTALRTVYDENNPQELRYRARVRNRATAITAFCITCTGGRKAVTECAATQCPLWAFRFGGDPFYGKRK